MPWWKLCAGEDASDGAEGARDVADVRHELCDEGKMALLTIAAGSR